MLVEDIFKHSIAQASSSGEWGSECLGCGSQGRVHANNSVEVYLNDAMQLIIGRAPF